MKNTSNSYSARCWRNPPRVRGLFLAVLIAAMAVASGVSAKTLGFVITNWRTSIYETPYYDECPEGLAIGNDEIWWKGLSPKDRDKFTNGGLIEPVDEPRRSMSVRRGPNGEDVCWRNDLVKDPPLRTVKGKISYGENLDGTQDGHETTDSCAHEKFTSPDGLQKVDNQIYRIVGCIYGWRKGNYVEDHAGRERRDTSKGIFLVEVTGVDDPQNSPNVQVNFYATDTVLSKDTDAKILPFASYVPNATNHYGASTHGRIVNGVLMTDPVDMKLPYFGQQISYDMFLRGIRLKMKIAQGEDGPTSSGTMAGYYDLASWLDYIRRIEIVLVTGQWDCPAVYDAAERLADGYRDPKTGKCTALSMAMDIEAQPAFVVHPKGSEKTAAIAGPQKTAQAAPAGPVN